MNDKNSMSVIPKTFNGDHRTVKKKLKTLARWKQDKSGFNNITKCDLRKI